MNNIEKNLSEWKESLLSSIPLAGLLSRNSVAYKWKATFRIWMLRESIFWRVQDLLTQSYCLHQQGHGLGARILLRSALESLAILIYLNQLIQEVLDNKLDFHKFSAKTSVLLLGSRNKETEITALNILTILKKSEKRYPGLIGLYSDLSECAHPNYEGLCTGYSTIDHEEAETFFSNRWMKIYGDDHLKLIELCMVIFLEEYDDIWSNLLDQLESWIETNDDKLEASSSDQLS